MMQVVNETPFVPGQAILYDKTAAEHLIVALKATFEISDQGELAVAEKQEPLRLAEEFVDEPGTSSIVHEAELCPPKPSTDVLLRGHAMAHKKGTTSMPVRFRVGKVGRQAVVFGPRVWIKKLGFGGISGPEPFESVPLIWENAFGGTDQSAEDPKRHDWEPLNPVGTGFRAKHSVLPWVDQPLPSIEDPGALFKKHDQRVEPVGFGPIGRNWEPRAGYAGTYDDAWMQERMPLLPDDFDDRFHNSAPPALVAPGYLEGGLPVEVAGCTRAERLAFRLPEIGASVEVLVRDRKESVDFNCETVTVDTDTMQLRLLWKGWLRVHRESMQVQKVEFRVEGELP